MQLFGKMRKTPKQQRSEQTVDAVLEAAAQVLQKEGEAGFTTNRIAEKAGFGIGTLYQYFPNKNSIIAALAERERAAIEARVRVALAQTEPRTHEDLVREVLRVLIRAFSGRRRLRRFVVLTALRSGRFEALIEAQRSIIGVIAEAVSTRQVGGIEGYRPLSPSRSFVLTRAVQGAVRSAVLEESPLLEEQEFEDDLVMLVMSFLRAAQDEGRESAEPR